MQIADSLRASSAACRATSADQPATHQGSAEQIKPAAPPPGGTHPSPPRRLAGAEQPCPPAVRIAERPGSTCIRDRQSVQDSFGLADAGQIPAAAAISSTTVASSSEKFRMATAAIEHLCSAVAGLQLDCEEQAEKPVFFSLSESLRRQRHTVHWLIDLETKALDAIRTIHQTPALTAQVEAMKQRRKNLVPGGWRLAACKDSTPEMLNVDSVEALVAKLKKVHAWCSRQMLPAVAQQRSFLKKLRALADDGELAERTGSSPRAMKKILRNQLDALDHAGSFLFDSLIPAGEIAVQRAGLLSHIAVERPKIELRIRCHAFRSAMRNALRAELAAWSPGPEADIMTVQDVHASAPVLAIAPAASDETAHGDDQVQRASASLTAAPAQAASIPSLHRSAPDRSSRKKTTSQLRRAPVHQPKYFKLKGSRSQQLPTIETECNLDSIAETDVPANNAVLEFYNAYGALRADGNAGWKGNPPVSNGRQR